MALASELFIKWRYKTDNYNFKFISYLLLYKYLSDNCIPQPYGPKL